MRHHWDSKRNYPRWRCTRKSCRKQYGYLTGTWFEGSHLSLKEIFQLSYYFCRQTHTYDEIYFDMQLEDGSQPSPNTVADFMNFYREMCGTYFAKNPTKIGGPGVIVEIDETVLTKRKYHRGQLRAEQQWVFGGVERETGRCFLWPVERRDAGTLLHLIQHFILPGTTIINDMWAAYNRIDQLPELYQHYTVNHSENFVNPDTGAHTQTIEGTWSHFKRHHREQMGTARTLFLSYVNQFCWRRLFKGDDIMFHLWSQIKEQYPLN